MASCTYRPYIVKYKYLTFFYVFVETHGLLDPLVSSALERLHSGFRPATALQYNSMFRHFLEFLEMAQLPTLQVNTVTLLSYMEYLHQKGLSHPNISNHLSAIRASFIMYGLDTQAFRDERIPLFVKALRINAPLSLKSQKIITIQMLQQILSICDSLSEPLIFKALYLFTFFSFLRMSNILPHSVARFDATRHLLRGDLIFAQNYCTIIIKWTKTLQDRQQSRTISIPHLGDSLLCPIKALQLMFQKYPAEKNSPLFLQCRQGSLVPLTDSVARKHLKRVSLLLQIQPPLTFHLFRKSATTWAFHNGVPMNQIMQHGTWTSDAVWRYIHSLPTPDSHVSRTFRHLLYL